jgi:hypothetical protein
MSKLEAAGNLKQHGQHHDNLATGWHRPSAQLLGAEVDRMSAVSLGSRECAVGLVPNVAPPN